MRSRVLRSLERQDVLVHCHGGPVFRGVLFDADSGAVELRNATLMSGANGAHVPVDGAVVIPRDEVVYFQRLS